MQYDSSCFPIPYGKVPLIYKTCPGKRRTSFPTEVETAVSGPQRWLVDSGQSECDTYRVPSLAAGIRIPSAPIWCAPFCPHEQNGHWVLRRYRTKKAYPSPRHPHIFSVIPAQALPEPLRLSRRLQLLREDGAIKTSAKYCRSCRLLRMHLPACLS